MTNYDYTDADAQGSSQVVSTATVVRKGVPKGVHPHHVTPDNFVPADDYGLNVTGQYTEEENQEALGDDQWRKLVANSDDQPVDPFNDERFGVAAQRIVEAEKDAKAVNTQAMIIRQSPANHMADAEERDNAGTPGYVSPIEALRETRVREAEEFVKTDSLVNEIQRDIKAAGLDETEDKTQVADGVHTNNTKTVDEKSKTK